MTFIDYQWNMCDTQHHRPNRKWVYSQRNWTAFQSYCKIPCRVSRLAVCRQSHKTNTSASADRPRHTEECIFCLNRKSYGSRLLWQCGRQPQTMRGGAALDVSDVALVLFVFILQVFWSASSSPLTFQVSSPTPPFCPPQNFKSGSHQQHFYSEHPQRMC